MFVAVDGNLAGLIAIADPIKPTSAAALAALQAEGIGIVMLTGDSRATARAVANKLGITDVEAEVLPERKGEIIARLKHDGRVVAMAGDGINDAPALAAADVGIAMGDGTDIAMASAGITLVKGDLKAVYHHHAQYPAKSIVRVSLQRRRRADRRRRTLSPIWYSIVAGNRRGGHGVVIGERHRQRVAAAPRCALAGALSAALH